MKKILTFTLALLVMVSMAACGNGSTNDIEAKDKSKAEENVNIEEEGKEEAKAASDNGEFAAKEAVEGFMDAFCEFDIAGMTEYCNINLVEEIGFSDIRSYVNQAFGSEFAQEETEELPQELVLVMDAMIDGLIDSTDYTINGSEYKDEKWIFDVTFQCVGTDVISEAFSGEDSEALMMDIMTKYEAEIMAAETEEQLNALMEKVTADIYASMVDLLKNAFANAEPTSKVGQLVAIKQDGKWIIDGNDGNIDAFAEIFVN